MLASRIRVIRAIIIMITSGGTIMRMIIVVTEIRANQLLVMIPMVMIMLIIMI